MYDDNDQPYQPRRTQNLPWLPQKKEQLPIREEVERSVEDITRNCLTFISKTVEARNKKLADGGNVTMYEAECAARLMKFLQEFNRDLNTIDVQLETEQTRATPVISLGEMSERLKDLMSQGGDKIPKVPEL
jgi:hypothetical protein